MALKLVKALYNCTVYNFSFGNELVSPKYKTKYVPLGGRVSAIQLIPFLKSVCVCVAHVNSIPQKCMYVCVCVCVCVCVRPMAQLPGNKDELCRSSQS